MCLLQFFFEKVPKIICRLESSIAYVHWRASLTSLITKSSFQQFGVYPLAKISLYFDILTFSPTSNLGIFSLFSEPKSKYMLPFTSVDFLLRVLWHGFLYSLTISVELSLYAVFDSEVIYL